MRINLIRKLMLGTLAAVTLMIGIGSATSAEAQVRVVRRPPRVVFYRPYRPLYNPFYWGPTWNRTYTVVDPIAARREDGYRDGMDKGKDDAKDGLGGNPERHKKFNKSKSLAYREAFLQGYAEGFNREVG